MAIVTTRTDDITPGVTLPEGAESTRLTLTDSRDSFDIEIDLGDENFKKLLTAVKKYRENGRAVVTATPKSRGNAAKDSESDAPRIRAWAQENPHLLPEGVAVPGSRGALNARVIAAYDAHNGESSPADDGDSQDPRDVDPADTDADSDS
jgi:hypothetical protein